MTEFRLEETAPLPHWTSCEACLRDDVRGEQARASYCLYHGEDRVFRFCEAHTNAAYAVIRAYLDLVRQYDDHKKVYRCLVSDNPVGTNTFIVGKPCDCAVCSLVAENLKLRVELDRPEPSPTWAELDNLNAEYKLTMIEHQDDVSISAKDLDEMKATVEHLEGQNAFFDGIARLLWQLLDNIDTADDLAKADDVYRQLVRAETQRRWAVSRSDEAGLHWNWPLTEKEVKALLDQGAEGVRKVGEALDQS